MRSRLSFGFRLDVLGKIDTAKYDVCLLQQTCGAFRQRLPDWKRQLKLDDFDKVSLALQYIKTEFGKCPPRDSEFEPFGGNRRCQIRTFQEEYHAIPGIRFCVVIVPRWERNRLSL
jgi:hypothetical protein